LLIPAPLGELKALRQKPICFVASAKKAVHLGILGLVYFDASGLTKLLVWPFPLQICHWSTTQVSIHRYIIMAYSILNFIQATRPYIIYKNTQKKAKKRTLIHKR